MRVIPAISLLVLLASPCPAATLCVSQTAPDPAHGGQSWGTAYATVKAALAASSPGDEVWVAAGTYKENNTLPSGVALYGGFTGTETSREQRDPKKNASILDGQRNGTPIITIPVDATSATILDGFTIQNSWAIENTPDGGEGAGVLIWGGTPVITGNLIRNCTAASYKPKGSYGGGIYVDSGMPLIAGNTFDHNSAGEGGGVYAISGLIRDNLFTNNSGHYYGGGVLLEEKAVAINNTFVGNTATTDFTVIGGGGGAGGYRGTLIDNVFIDNRSSSYASTLWFSSNSTVMRNLITSTAGGYAGEVVFDGGVFADNLIATYSYDPALTLGMGVGNENGTEPLIANNTIVGRNTIDPTSIQFGVSSWYISGEKPVFVNNIITGFRLAAHTENRGGTAPTFSGDHNLSYGNTENTIALQGVINGTLYMDPLFVSSSTGDYHLKAGSPCIDAGNDSVVKPQDRDVEGKPRVAGAHVDIGAYEYGSPLYTVQDAATVLRIAAGISLSTPADLSRLDVAGETGLTVTDATRIAQWLLN